MTKSRLQKAWTRYFRRVKKYDPEGAGYAITKELPAEAHASAFSRSSRNCTPKQLFQRMMKFDRNKKRGPGGILGALMEVPFDD
jgi:hypothetical protein